jgi:hypothetical protein
MCNMATTETITADPSTVAPAPVDLAEQLTGLQNRLFDVCVLLRAMSARLDQLEEEGEVYANACDELGRLVALAGREVHRLACGGAVEAAA